jgi:peptide/nickel transport system permease protein
MSTMKRHVASSPVRIKYLSAITVPAALKHRGIAIGGTLFFLLILIAVFAPLIAPHNPLALQTGHRLQRPSLVHLWGTDNLGRDIFSRVLYGTRVSLLVGASVSILTGIGGTVIGLWCGYFAWLDGVLMRIMDGLMAFPDVLLAIAIMAAFGPHLTNVILALFVVYTPRVARIVRSAVLVQRETVYVEAAKAIGAQDARILFRHVLPNCLGPLIVQVTYTYALAILVEASLSFLGVGIPPAIPSWGNILADTRLYIRSAPWMPVLPGVAIMVAVLVLNLLGDGLRDVLDPHARKR